VLKIGVIAFIDKPDQTLKEMACVLKPAGHLIVSADNSWRLSNVLNPRLNPLLTRLRKTVGGVLERSGLRKRKPAPPSVSHSLAEFDALLSSVGLEKTEGTTLGFGPFWFFDYKLPDSVGISIHYRLQILADRRFPVLRSTGAHYVVLAKKLARDRQIS
jgi:hypothetical protein